jgi:hypothetical protein
MTVALREVTKEDLPIFFEHQLDAEATRRSPAATATPLWRTGPES